MKSSEYQELLAKALRSELAPREQERWKILLNSDPELAQDAALEFALEKVLEELPEALVSSNFTALVLQAAKKSGIGGGGSASRRNYFFSWLSLARSGALAGIVLAGGLFFYQQHQSSLRQDMAQNLVRISNELESKSKLAGGVPSPELLQNFDAIYRLAQVPVSSDVDTDLLAALQDRP